VRPAGATPRTASRGVRLPGRTGAATAHRIDTGGAARHAHSVPAMPSHYNGRLMAALPGCRSGMHVTEKKPEHTPLMKQ